ncbi:MAG: N-acetylneuraminate synthase family protein [Spirochaetales bacterium]
MEKPLYVIAEIGTSHLGDRRKARELIFAAAEAGADCAKFQVVFADEIIHPLTGELDLPGGRVRLYDKFREVEQDEDFYRFLKDETEAAGMDFLASPFGVRSARLLQNLQVSAFKVASPELNHLPLLTELRSFGKPVILSSGVSTLGDIEAAVNLLEGLPVSLLHCITAYPAPPEEYNLRVLEPMAVLFGCPVGISDHSLDAELVPLVGLLAGATLLEKHFCLSRQDVGLDDPIALDPQLFGAMVKSVRRVEVLAPDQKRAAVDAQFGTARVEAVLGTGRKRLAPAEAANYERTNRSLHVIAALKKGQVLSAEMVAELRTEKVLRPGLAPHWREAVVGRVLTRDIGAGEGLVWDDLLVQQPHAGNR